MSRTCLDCAAPISRKSTGRCRRCAMTEVNRRPEKIARVAEQFGKRRPSIPAPVGDALVRRNEAIRRAHLRWCPQRHWALNERLRRRGYRLVERKAMIADLVRAEDARAVAEVRRRFGVAT